MKPSHFLAGALFGIGLILIVRAQWVTGFACAAVALVIVDMSKGER